MGKKTIFGEIVENIMSAHGGYASLQLMNREFEKNSEKYRAKYNIRGKTPLASLRRELQRNVNIERIGLGVYALKNATLPIAPPANTKVEKSERKHAAIQGILLEIGNNRNECADTYTPDKRQIFNRMELGKIATLNTIPKFTYPKIIQSARFIDVMWFNKRGFPDCLFEVEHSTNFVNAMTKFCELQDFHVKCYCIAEDSRRDKFERELSKSAFLSIKDRCEFRSYEQIEEDYEIAMKKPSI